MLEGWEHGRLTALDVLNAAEDLVDEAAHREYAETNPDSIPWELLRQLGELHIRWIIEEDIPVMLQFLETPRGKEREGWMAWRSYWDRLDFARRGELLKGDPFYIGLDESAEVVEDPDLSSDVEEVYRRRARRLQKR